MKKKKKTPMEKLTKGYEEFIKDKEVIKEGEIIFKKVLKKAVKPKNK